MDRDQLIAKVDKIGPWFHSVEVADGVLTRAINPSPGPQPIDHPRQRWRSLEPHLPASMQGMKVLDIGSADGFFSIEFARRGANVVAIDAAGKMVDRVKFLAKHLKLPIKAQVGQGETMDASETFDVVFNLGLLYHSRHPLLLLEKLAPLAPVMFLETTITQGEGSYLYFKPPQAGVHHIPKWFPTHNVVIEMLKFVGFTKFEVFDYETPDRLFLRAEK